MTSETGEALSWSSCFTGFSKFGEAAGDEERAELLSAALISLIES